MKARRPRSPIGHALLRWAVVVLWTMCAPITTSAAPPEHETTPHPHWNTALREFERSSGSAAVVVTDLRSGLVRYMYNEDYVLRRVFPPGSLVKTLSAAIFERHAARFQFDPGRPVQCRGRYYPAQPISAADRRDFHVLEDEAGRPYVRCSKDRGHGRVQLTSALAQSCNVYFLTTAARNASFYDLLIQDWQLSTSPSTGLRERTETPARVLAGRSLSPLARTMAAVGEGGSLRFTPLKVNQLYAALLADPDMGAYRRLPQLRLSSDYTGRSPLTARAGPRLAFTASQLDPLRFALGRVLQDGGTLAGFAAPDGVAVRAAKTGTATVFGKKYETHGWVVLRVDAGGRAYVVTAFAGNGSGGKEARRLAEITVEKLFVR